MEHEENIQFETVIKPVKGWFNLKLGEVVKYRDLIAMFVRRNFATLYKQTVLGPIWIIITPMITTLIQTVVFGNIANIGTDGIPTFLFYMAGNTAWGYFSTCFTGTSNTFVSNSAIFGKIYFPRLVMPISTIITELIRFSIQFVMFLGFLVFYTVKGSVHPHYAAIPLLLVVLLVMGVMGLGFGIIISSMTTKYRDLTVLVSFGVTLWMYATPIVYPLSLIPARWYKLFMLNPMASIIETFRYIFLGVGELKVGYLLYSAAVAVIAVSIGTVLFSRVEKNFMDTV